MPERLTSERTKISDVAARAGVSPATVSRVVNGTGEVSSALATRVRDAVAELGYVPFSPARALRRRLTDVWAVIVADIENPFFTSVVRGIEDVASSRGLRVVLCNSDEDPAKEADYIEVAIAERMSGVIISLSGAQRSILDPLLSRGIPVVAVDRRPVGRTVDAVLTDNHLGADEATTHLIQRGYERIACITGPRRITTADERLGGYRSALTRAGRAYTEDLVVRGDFRPAGGYEAVKLLAARADALFVANNQMTIGALQALRDLGRRVPRDVGVIGYDDAPWATLIQPQLSVVAQPTYQIGETAAHLLATAAERRGQPAVEVRLPPTLIVRESTCR